MSELVYFLQKFSRLRTDRTGGWTVATQGQDTEIAGKVVDFFQNELYQAMKRGQSVTRKNFGGFYVRTERESWVFKFNPCQNMAAHFMRALFGWSSTYKGEL